MDAFCLTFRRHPCRRPVTQGAEARAGAVTTEPLAGHSQHLCMPCLQESHWQATFKGRGQKREQMRGFQVRQQATIFRASGKRRIMKHNPR